MVILFSGYSVERLDNTQEERSALPKARGMVAGNTQTLQLQRLYRQLDRKLPLREVRISVGEREWTVIAARSQEDLLDMVQTDGDLQRFPYGLLLWTSAVGLARRLAAEPALIHEKTALELGAGVGLPGMVAQALGAKVTQTDYQADALNLARINAHRNGVEEIRYLLADWREFYPAEIYDVVLGSDILYERTLHAEVARILRRVLAPGGTLLFADPLRPQAVEFMSRLEGEGWRIEMEGLTVEWQDETREIAFFRGQRRATHVSPLQKATAPDQGKSGGGCQMDGRRQRACYPVAAAAGDFASASADTLRRRLKGLRSTIFV